jgi:GNAT superfamily N-acetyltransferase
MSELNRIRPALLDDAAQIAPLVSELGYSASINEVRSRIADLLGSTSGVVYVAVNCDSKIVGWIHVSIRLTLESGLDAEIVGLVVSTAARRTGVGKTLLFAAEEWAALHNLTSVVVRSNVTRTESHPFYEAAGYDRGKTQHFYRKVIAGERASRRGYAANDYVGNWRRRVGIEPAYTHLQSVHMTIKSNSY